MASPSDMSAVTGTIPGHSSTSCFEIRRAARRRDDVRTALVQQRGEPPPEAAGRTGDDGDTVVDGKQIVHRLCLSRCSVPSKRGGQL